MTSPLDNPNIQALRAAATLAASAPVIAQDSSKEDRAKAEEVWRAAVKASGAVLAGVRPSKGDVAALRDPGWVDGLNERERVELAALMGHHGPLNVVHRGYGRLWIEPARRAGSLGGLR